MQMVQLLPADREPNLSAPGAAPKARYQALMPKGRDRMRCSTPAAPQISRRLSVPAHKTAAKSRLAAEAIAQKERQSPARNPTTSCCIGPQINEIHFNR
jgi:hypothetical protein